MSQEPGHALMPRWGYIVDVFVAVFVAEYSLDRNFRNYSWALASLELKRHACLTRMGPGVKSGPGLLQRQGRALARVEAI